MDVPDLLYAAVGRTVLALDRFTGRPVWRVKLPRLLGGSISMVLPYGREVYVGRGGYVYCLDRHTGGVLWERGLGGSGNLTLMSMGAGDGEMQQASAVAAAAAAARAAAAAAG